MDEEKILTDQELFEYSEKHLLYELRMLFWATALLHYGVSDIKGVIASAINNAVLNSFSIHARNLIEFLYPPDKPKFKTNVTISHYIAPEDIKKVRSPITQLLTEARIKTNKQVSHLTMERLDYEREGKGWDYEGIFRDILHVFYRTASLFPTGRVSPAFIQEITKKQVALPKLKIKEIFKGEDAVGIEFIGATDDDAGLLRLAPVRDTQFPG